MSSSLAGFGSTAATSPFGQKPAFGQPAAGGSLFGGTANNTASTGGFGSFGQATNTANTGFGGTTSGFGANNASTGFGSTAATGGSLFGGGGSTTNTGFGATNGFGAATNTNTGFGAAAASSAQNTGTGGTPFSEFTDKDQNTTNKFQSITCMPQYQNFSFEELRTTDYAQGRKHGNASGQAGAFGTSTGFGGGGFGQTNNTATTGFGSTATNTGGMFGQQQNASGFGSTTTNTGFGSNTGGGLFGQAKPANSMFGGTTAATTGGSIFGGTNNNTTGGFGSTTTPAFGAATTGSVFGQPSKTPGTFGVGSGTGFGSTNTSSGFGTPANTGSAFGQTNNTNTTGGGLFGQPANTNNTSGFGGFGQNQQNQTQPTNAFGGFGQNNNNQAKPLFGQTTTTGTNAFGQPAQQQPATSLFGNTQNQNQTTNAFGGFGQKAATPTNNLFGQTTNNNTGTSLFGQTQNNQNQGGGLFGQTQQKPSLFGNTNTNNTGGGLFGNTQNNNQQQNNSLFGNTQNQQSGFGGGNSMFNGSLQGNQQQLTTSIMSNNPYGNEHLFANLGSPQQAVGPLATPLSSSQKARKPAPLPTYKLNPSASSRLITPQKRSGYGFDYASYGTPGSAYSTASSPMYGGSLLSNSRFGNSLNRSLSTSSLVRSSLSPSESILNPNAFSTGASRAGGSGSLKKLRINRNLRTDLFGSADNTAETTRTSPLKKSVTFGGEEHEQQEDTPIGQTSQALVRVQENDEDMPSAEEQGYLRSSGSRAAPRTNGASARPEMQQVSKESAASNEKEQPSAPAAKPKTPAEKERESALRRQVDMAPGEYYMTPSLDELKKMSRKELSSIEPFVVGREGCGKIEFSKVDLTDVNLDEICGDIVCLNTRVATVYQDHGDKPDAGKGLNVPSVVTMSNSFPRAQGGKVQILEKKGPKYDKHLRRLQRVEDTEFLDYHVETGEWVFAVEHFSTYTLDYSDDEDSVMDSPAGTPARQQGQNSQGDTSMVSNESSAQDSNVDDTFEFRSSRALPGAFDQDEQMYIDEVAGNGLHEDNQDVMSDEEENHGVVRGHGMNDRKDSSVFDETIPMDEEEERSFQKHSPGFAASLKPKSILKASQGFKASHNGTPLRKPVIGADWATQLQRTISPKKQDRQMLRESQGIFPTAPFLQSTRERPQVNFAASTKISKDTKPFATSIDLMNSLFGQSTNKVPSPAAKPTGLQV